MLAMTIPEIGESGLTVREKKFFVVLGQPEKFIPLRACGSGWPSFLNVML